MPQSVYKDAADIPEALKEHYEDQGGQWVLKLEGDHPAVAAVVRQANEKVAEFRNNNIGLNQTLDGARAELEAWKALGLSPQDAQAALERGREAETKAKGAKTSEDVQAAIQAALKPVTDALAAERQARLDAETKASTEQLEGTLTRAGLKAGVAESALPDYLSRGKGVFQLRDGQLTPVGPDGSPIYSSKRPGEIVTVEEWATDLQAEAPHLYKPSGGAGAEEPSGVRIASGSRVISAVDLSDNLEDVASGKAVVQ